MSTAPLAPRSDFPLLAAAPALTYLDSAATAQKPRAVLDAITGYYTRANANPHRGAYALAATATQAYHALVQQRIEQLRETPIPGTQSLGEFVLKRVSPAISTVQASGWPPLPRHGWYFDPRPRYR